MKKEKIYILAFLFLLQTSVFFAQFRIDPSGHIGMGTNYPNPGYKCHVKGDLLLTTYPEIPPPYSSFVELKLKVSSGAQIGCNNGTIDFWSAEAGYNTLNVAGIYAASDSTLKTNIVPVTGTLDKIMKLKPCSYKFKSDAARSKSGQKITFGFLAQDVEKVIPNITTTSGGIKLIDYMQIIPLLVNAVQEQNKKIENLKEEVDNLTEKLNSCCSKTIQSSETSDIISNAANLPVLYQNQPNPFSEKTTIAYSINGSMSNASVLVFDMQGTLKKTFPITKAGKGEITILGNELKAGMYLYSLIVDNKEIDTKRMILNN
jgi:hypothetical protein